MVKSIKSKQRVFDFGEVFTNEREVKEMCDLAENETYRIDSLVLEPACGNGNFLAEILRRKLSTAEKRYGKNIYEFERYSILAVMSLYGVDILEDNAQECRERLFEIWESNYGRVVMNGGTLGCKDAVKYVLECNILCGDALTLLQNDGDPIIFAEWAFISNKYIKRRDFNLSTMLEMQTNAKQGDLFFSSEEYDEKIGSYVPKPIKDDYSPCEYWRIQEWKTK